MGQAGREIRSEPVIRIQGLCKSFGKLDVLKGIDVVINKGEVVCIIGPSGSGKRTLLRGINFLEEPTSGRVYINARPIGYRQTQDGRWIRDRIRTLNRIRAEIGIVFQSYNLWPHKTALGNVIEALLVVRKMEKARAIELG